MLFRSVSMTMPRFKDGSKIIQSRLAVVERQPKKIVVFVVLSIVLLGLSFYIGKEVGVFEARIFREKVSELETALDSLAENHEVIENEFQKKDDYILNIKNLSLSKKFTDISFDTPNCSFFVPVSDGTFLVQSSRSMLGSTFLFSSSSSFLTMDNPDGIVSPGCPPASNSCLTLLEDKAGTISGSREFASLNGSVTTSPGSIRSGLALN